MRLHEVMWLNKYALTALGLWKMHTESTLAHRLFGTLQFLVGLFAVISLLVPEVITVAIYWGDIGILGDFGSLIVIHYLMTLKSLYFYCRRRRFRSIYQHLKEFWYSSEDPEDRRHYEQLAKLAKQVTIAFTLASISNVLTFEVTALVTWLKNRREMNETLRHRPLILELEYGFDTQRTPIYELLLIWQSFGGTCVAIGVIGFDCTVMVYVVHVSAQFRLIAARFRAIGHKISEQMTVQNKELRVEIGKCVAQHQYAIKVTEELGSLLSPIVFGQIVTSGLGICLGGYAVIEGEGNFIDIAKFFVLFVSLLLQLVLWCAPAEFLIQESSAIAETIYYEVPWFRLEPSLRRDLNFVMTRAQKACHVSAFYQIVSIRRITEVCNAAGSYMALLRSMK